MLQLRVHHYLDSISGDPVSRTCTTESDLINQDSPGVLTEATTNPNKVIR